MHIIVVLKVKEYFRSLQMSHGLPCRFEFHCLTSQPSPANSELIRGPLPVLVAPSSSEERTGKQQPKVSVTELLWDSELVNRKVKFEKAFLLRITSEQFSDATEVKVVSIYASGLQQYHNLGQENDPSPRYPKCEVTLAISKGTPQPSMKIDLNTTCLREC